MEVYSCDKSPSLTYRRKVLKYRPWRNKLSAFISNIRSCPGSLLGLHAILD